ncbi:MAG: hypothetical protein JNL79_10935 [Myxococcales bacterium]|nr:hypothetical protein [Myxococcales bacterium]
MLTLVLSGCGTTHTYRVLTGAARPAFDGPVRVVLEPDLPPAGFQEIAIIEAKCAGTHADLEHVVAGLQREAARLGCTIVVRVRIDQGASLATGTGVCGIVP